MNYYNNTSNYIIAFILFMILIFLVLKEYYVLTYLKKSNIAYVDVTTNAPKQFPPIKVYDGKPEANTAEDLVATVPPTTTQSPTTTKPIDPRKQVFNLSENVYTYDDAKLACKSMGARLASMKEMTEVYKDGANWCNYGWSKDQLALFPIQKEYWDKIQKDDKLKKSCGFPGINGGYFKNDKFLFGANCYGAKPDPKGDENEPVYADKIQNQYNTAKLYLYENDIPKVAPFSNNKWSKYTGNK
jgi:hypothetical protein